jgi:hypothetical protein
MCLTCQYEHVRPCTGANVIREYIFSLHTIPMQIYNQPDVALTPWQGTSAAHPARHRVTCRHDLPSPSTLEAPLDCRPESLKLRRVWVHRIVPIGVLRFSPSSSHSSTQETYRGQGADLLGEVGEVRCELDVFVFLRRQLRIRVVGGCGTE